MGGYGWQHAPSLAAAMTTGDRQAPQTRRCDTGRALGVVHPRQNTAGCVRRAVEPAEGLFCTMAFSYY